MSLLGKKYVMTYKDLTLVRLGRDLAYSVSTWVLRFETNLWLAPVQSVSDYLQYIWKKAWENIVIFSCIYSYIFSVV